MTTMTGVPALGWRRRHPVLSRTLLYAVALGLVGGVALLRRERKEEERLDYLVKRLDGLGLVFVQDRTGDTVVVSEEVGLSVHPTTEAGRRFVDVLGEVNRAVGDAADRVLLVVAGRVVPLERGV